MTTNIHGSKAIDVQDFLDSDERPQILPNC